MAKLNLGLKIVYTGDTKACKTVVKLAKDADMLIHDSTFLDADKEKGQYHATTREAAEIAKKANVKQLILTHVSRRYTDIKPLEEEAKEVFTNSKVAHDFMKVRLKG